MKQTFWILLLTVSFQLGYGQFQIDSTHTAEHLVQSILLGQGVLAGNVTYTGSPYSLAAFEDRSSITDIRKGLVLTSGNAFYLPGPNRSSFTGWAGNMPGDEHLNRLTPGITYDAAVLEFDFVTTSENLSFRYVFGSEEYQEYVGSKYNDVFGFFISGPGLNDVNLARIPDTRIPIAINNVNHKKNRKYYRDNDFKNIYDRFVWDERANQVVENKYFGRTETLPAYDIQYDGFTTVLTASCKVVPGEIYHIKLAIADVSDGILDSGVLFEAGSFISHGKQIVHRANPFKKSQPVLQPVVKVPPLKSIQVELSSSLLPKLQPEVIYFDFDSDYTKKRYQQHLQQVAQKYHSGNYIIEIAGHTDSIGSEQYNLSLSQRRAESVVQELMMLGLSEDDMQVKFFGENQPVVSNTTSSARARNRRVEVMFVQKEETVANNTDAGRHTSAQMNNHNNSSVY